MERALASCGSYRLCHHRTNVAGLHKLCHSKQKRSGQPARCSGSRSAPSSEDNGEVAERNNYLQSHHMPSSSQAPSEPAIPPKQTGVYITELRRETFAGRVAILTLGAMLLGERLTGRGIVQTLNHSTKIPLWEMEPLLGVGVIALFFVALYPSRTPLLQPSTTGMNVYRGAQRLVGRVACLLLAGTIIVEVVTGKGALALFNIETGKEALDEAEIVFAFFALLFLTASIGDTQDP